MLANQVYGPYGTKRYKSGPMLTYTTKGFTGQYADTVTGLDYYNARYYDPAAGVFLSADTKQGNMQGMNPYGYVGGNPETRNDPTGEYYAPPGGPGGPTPPPPCNQSNNFCGTGNGGNQGSGGKSSQKKAPVKLGGCDATCQQERLTAYHDAQVARNHFQSIQNNLSSKIFWLISAVMSILGFYGDPLIGGAISGFALGLAALGNIAGDIAKGFRAETDMVDLVVNEKIGIGWFTKGNVTASGNHILGAIAPDSLSYVYLALGAGIATLLAGGSVAVVAPEIAGAMVPLIIAGLSAGDVAAGVAGVGAIQLYGDAQGYIAQEERDAP